MHSGPVYARSNGGSMSYGPASTSRNGDGRLVDAFRAGQGEAFEEIVRRHYPALLRVAERRCGASALAQDAVQAALLRAHRYLRGAGSVDNLGAWLRRIVYNCSTDLLKRNDRRSVSLAADLPAPAQAGLEGKELRALVAEAFAKLPEIYRAPLAMSYLHGLDAREIAQQLDENLHSIKSRIARGRRELRRRLEPVLIRAGYLS